MAHWFERFWRVVVTLNTNNMDVCGIYPYIPHWLTQAVPPSVHHSPQGLGCRALSSLVWWEMTLLREQGLNWVILKGPFQHKPLHGSLKPHFPHTFCNEYRHTPHVGVFSVGFAGFFVVVVVLFWLLLFIAVFIFIFFPNSTKEQNTQKWDDAMQNQRNIALGAQQDVTGGQAGKQNGRMRSQNKQLQSTPLILNSKLIMHKTNKQRNSLTDLHCAFSKGGISDSDFRLTAAINKQEIPTTLDCAHAFTKQTDTRDGWEELAKTVNIWYKQRLQSRNPNNS